MADITAERLREIVTSDPLALAICAQMGEPSWADVRAIAAELLAARAEIERLREDSNATAMDLVDERDDALADLREAIELLRAFRRDRHTIADWEPIWDRADELVMKHKETP